MATSTAAVCTSRPEPRVAAPASRTAIVETTRPARESAQYGTAWRMSAPGPRRPHTQRRLSSKEGTVPTAVAMTFDNVGE